MTRHAALMALLVCATAGLTGCNRPAFNVAGDYEGNMWTPSGGTCPLSMSLIHFDRLWYPLNHKPAGLVTFDLICLMDQPVLDAFLSDLPQMVTPVIGTISEDVAGEITFSIDTAQLDLPFAVAFTCTGIGMDTDEDGSMDIYVGTYTLLVTIQTDIAGFEEITIQFTDAFEVFAVD